MNEPIGRNYLQHLEEGDTLAHSIREFPVETVRQIVEVVVKPKLSDATVTVRKLFGEEKEPFEAKLDELYFLNEEEKRRLLEDPEAPI